MYHKSNNKIKELKWLLLSELYFDIIYYTPISIKPLLQCIVRIYLLPDTFFNLFYRDEYFAVSVINVCTKE